ncbi:mismatch-specific DNA-glycosylase [Aurantivibrio plasticivorans]
MLNDLLSNNLKLVICGTAAGSASAQLGQYYAGRGNKIWKTLFDVGLTDCVLRPSEYHRLIEFGIGLTDVVKDQSGMDSAIDFAQAGIVEFELKMIDIQPEVVCFNGKKAAQVYLRSKNVDFGLQDKMIGNSKMYVAPSTSGAANRSWDVGYWYELANVIGK